jgi:hypothetical protein
MPVIRLNITDGEGVLLGQVALDAATLDDSSRCAESIGGLLAAVGEVGAQGGAIFGHGRIVVRSAHLPHDPLDTYQPSGVTPRPAAVTASGSVAASDGHL